MFRKFSEYLNTQGKTQEKPVIDPLADTSPKPTKAPDKPVSKGKGWDACAALSEKPKNYAGPGTDNGQQMQPKGEKNGKGLDKEGDSKLIYEPKTVGANAEGGKKLSSWPKTTKTEQFLEETRGMTLSEFAAYVSSQTKVGTADPVQTVRNAVAMANANDTVLVALVREFKRSGGMDRLVAEMFKHQETFVELAQLMMNEREGGATYRRLQRAVAEVTAPPATGDEVDTGAGSPPQNEPGIPAQGARRPVRSIGGQDNQMDMSGGGANIMASQGQGAPTPPQGAPAPMNGGGGGVGVKPGFAARMSKR